MEDNMSEEQLLGDLIEEQLKKLKVDKVVDAISKVTKKPCGCGKRKQQLNRLHQKLKG
jgi:hypothetical protein